MRLDKEKKVHDTTIKGISSGEQLRVRNRKRRKLKSNTINYLERTNIFSRYPFNVHLMVSSD